MSGFGVSRTTRPPARILAASRSRKRQEHHRSQVLDYVRAEDAAEAFVVKGLQVRERVALDDVEPFPRAEGDHVGVRVDAAGGDACVAQETRGTRRGHSRRRARALGRGSRRRTGPGVPDLVAALPHPPFEREVVERNLRRRLRGRSCGRSLDRRGPSPLDTQQAVVELRRASRQSLFGLRDLLGEPLGRLVELGPLLLATPALGVDARRRPDGQVVDKAQDGAVERPLLGGDRARRTSARSLRNDRISPGR